MDEVGVAAAGRPYGTRERRRPVVVMVSGPAGAGKSELARRIGAAACLPVVSRDAVKGGICFTRGRVPDGVRDAAADAFWGAVDGLLDHGVSLVAEWALHRSTAAERLAALARRADVRLVHCSAPRAVLLARVTARLAADPGARWPFPDREVARALADPGHSLADFGVPDRPPGGVLEVDTADGYRPGLAAVLAFCLDTDTWRDVT